MWCSRKHRKANERSGWRELHIGVDGDGYVVAEVLTENTVDDADVVPALLGQVDAPVKRFTGDGGYDKRGVYEAVSKAGDGDVGVAVVVPPSHGWDSLAKGRGRLRAAEPASRLDRRGRETGVRAATAAWSSELSCCQAAPPSRSSEASSGRPGLPPASLSTLHSLVAEATTPSISTARPGRPHCWVWGLEVAGPTPQRS